MTRLAKEGEEGERRRESELNERGRRKEGRRRRDDEQKIPPARVSNLGITVIALKLAYVTEDISIHIL